MLHLVQLQATLIYQPGKLHIITYYQKIRTLIPPQPVQLTHETRPLTGKTPGKVCQTFTLHGKGFFQPPDAVIPGL
jgi:hypothetical protein